MRNCARFALAALIVLCSVTVGHAIPQLINYQGILTDGGGVPIRNQIVNVEFRIHDAAASGSETWMETQNVTTDNDGGFNVLLGSVNPIPDSAFAAAAAYLGLTISPDPEMTPRTQLVAVPYAFRPGTVDGATGGTISGDVAIQSDLTVSGKATIGPAHTNTGSNAFVAGASNTASGPESTVGGGTSNTASGPSATVAGGFANTASVEGATVGGGFVNLASGGVATVGGGANNTASGVWSVVAGGSDNTASGDYSFAAGRRAKANHAGTFVWADDTNADFASTGIKQFLIEAGGGVGINTSTPTQALTINGTIGFEDSADPMLMMYEGCCSGPTRTIVAHNPLNPDWGIVYRDTDDEMIFQAGNGNPILSLEFSALQVGIGVENPSRILQIIQNSATDPQADAWTVYSSRRWKENIVTIDNALDKVQRLRGVEYDWKANGEHDIGLIAEEVGEVIPEVVQYEDNGVDAESVDYARLVAVLIEAVKEQQEQISDLQSENESLSERLQRMEREL